MSPTNEPPVRARFDPERWAWLIAPIGAILVALAFTVSPLLAVVGVALMALSCVTAEREFLLFGPFLKLELTRMSRKQRIHLWRPIVAAAMGLPVLVLYYAAFSESSSADVTPTQAKMIASGGFAILFFYLVLICGSAGLTYLSYAIAEDRESKRMDFVLVTDLRGRELVIGKLFARAFGMAMYVLPAVPIILSLPLLFGVEPEIILYTFGYFGVTMLSLAGLAALGSVKAATKKASGGWILKYVIPYLALSFSLQMLQNYPSIWFFPGAPNRMPTVSVGDVVDWISTGNLVARLTTWFQVAGGGVAGIARDFPAYAAFHTAVGLLACMRAASLLRGFSAEDRLSGGGKTNEDARTVRPPIDDYPIRWKEQFCNPLLAKFGNRKRANGIAFFVLFGIPTAAFLVASVSDVGGYGKDIIAGARFYPMLIVVLMMSSASTYGLYSIAQERERDTLTSLLLTPIEPKEIMAQKRRGILGLTRGIAIGLVLASIGPIACGAWAWWAYPVLVAFAIELAFIGVARGMLQSANAPTVEVAQRRNGWQTLIALVVGSALFGLLIYLTGGMDSPLKYLFVGLIPPAAVIGLGAAQEVPFNVLWLYAGGYVLGFFSNLLIARWLWRLAVRRFEAACDPATEAGPLLDRSANERETPNGGG